MPETVKKFISLGATVVVEVGAGVGASISDEDYSAAGAQVVKDAAAENADIVLGVQGPEADLLASAKLGDAPGACAAYRAALRTELLPDVREEADKYVMSPACGVVSRLSTPASRLP